MVLLCWFVVWLVVIVVCFGGGLFCVLVVSDLVLVGCLRFSGCCVLFAVLLVWSLAWVAVGGLVVECLG